MAEPGPEEMVPEQTAAAEDAIPYCDIKSLAERYNIPKDLSKRQTKKLVKRYRKEEFKAEWKCVHVATCTWLYIAYLDRLQY